jgi:ribosomal silencing factor RsfS
MLKDSAEYVKTRNDVYKELRTKSIKAKSAPSEDKEAWTALDLSSLYILLICVPENRECYEILHLMQYFGVVFEVEEDNPL